MSLPLPPPLRLDSRRIFFCGENPKEREATSKKRKNSKIPATRRRPLQMCRTFFSPAAVEKEKKERSHRATPEADLREELGTKSVCDGLARGASTAPRPLMTRQSPVAAAHRIGHQQEIPTTGTGNQATTGAAVCVLGPSQRPTPRASRMASRDR